MTTAWSSMKVPVVVQLDIMPDSDWYEICTEGFIQDAAEVIVMVLIGLLGKVKVEELVEGTNDGPPLAEVVMTDDDCIAEVIPPAALVGTAAPPIQEKM
jgi:hypothetical protein